LITNYSYFDFLQIVARRLIGQVLELRSVRRDGSMSVQELQRFRARYTLSRFLQELREEVVGKESVV
jgi:hypothetical protein